MNVGFVGKQSFSILLKCVLNFELSDIASIWATFKLDSFPSQTGIFSTEENLYGSVIEQKPAVNDQFNFDSLESIFAFSLETCGNLKTKLKNGKGLTSSSL